MSDLVPIAQQALALLFSEGGPLTFKKLAAALGCNDLDLRTALDTLAVRLEGSGLVLVRSDTEAVLAIAPTAQEVVTRKVAEEYETALGDAALEVLAILLYEGPSTRATVDYIRGVNSTSSLRTLLLRGLIERSGNPLDGREFMYRATTDLLAHLGCATREDVPEYGTISRELDAFKTTEHNHATPAESINTHD
jgi:segregation and condensation protein B